MALQAKVYICEVLISNTFEKIKLIEGETHLWFAHLGYKRFEHQTFCWLSIAILC